ncbi:MAG: Uncharacterized protein G01um101477_74 [Candidatus Doudnabacteria bacterium Gr01-1014_77]|uniref:Uncharacterized protein n=1 Tax=Candidatus Doudnabacteria bacterium Gr01-1014_77 TaxID=2017133 RepID=A0A554JDU9_9BACT|nr:MAG: Uncharacterized protein G01um101477_74 [Candidatus Doudnabacteria bacterium Gr01-1014_77]
MRFCGILKETMSDFQKEKIEIEIQEKEIETKEFLQSFSKERRYAIYILVGLLIPIFFIAKYSVSATYLHFFKANREIGVHEAIVTSLPVQILETNALSILGNSYSAYALIKNPNKDLVASELKYVFHFQDAEGKDLVSQEGKTFILGGEQKYIVMPNVKIFQAPVSVKVEITDPVWKRRLSLPNVVLKSGVPKYGDQTDPIGFYISNSLYNQSTYTLGTVKVNAVVFDNSGKVIAVTQYTANTVSPQQTRDYKMFWPLPIAANVLGDPKIFVETNILDDTNLKAAE